MLFNTKDIPKHAEKITILKSEPERIKRYKNKSLDMWQTAIAGDYHMLKLVESEDLTLDLIEIAIEHFNDYSVDWKCDNFTSSLESLSFTDFTPSIITNLHNKGLRVVSLIQNKLAPELFNEDMAKIFAEKSGYSALSLMNEFPEHLKNSISLHGCSLATNYMKLAPLSRELIILAFESSVKDWVGTNHYSKNYIIDFWAVVPDAFKGEDAFLDAMVNAGYFLLIDESKRTKERSFMAAKRKDFISDYYNIHNRNDKTISDMQKYWTAKNIEQYITSVKGGLCNVNRIKNHLTGVDSYVFDELTKKAVGFDVGNLKYVECDFPATPKMVGFFAKEHPLNIWELPGEWLLPEHIDIAIDCNPQTILEDNATRISAENVLRAISVDPKVLTSDLDINYRTARYLRLAMNEKLARWIANNAPYLYKSVVSTKHYKEKDLLIVIQAGDLGVLEKEEVQKEPYISQAALFQPEKFIKWAHKHGYIMADMALNTPRFQNAVNNYPEIIRVIAQYARIGDVVEISRALHTLELQVA